MSITTEKAEEILRLAVQLGNSEFAQGTAPAYSDSTTSESFLVRLLQEASVKLGLDKEIIEHHGGHSFPDVTIMNSPIGIELKGVKNHRTFNGNSVVASTMKTGLKKIFLFYWIGELKEIGFRDYFECVATPVVTHSPRFRLDLDLKAEDSMFGVGDGKIGTVEEIIFGSSSIESDKIIKWMTDKAKANGESPWWITSEEDEIPTGSTGLMKFTNMSQEKRQLFLKAAFLAFPQILDKSSRTKYSGFFEWAIQKKSVYMSRDDFSAGGKIAIQLPEFSAESLLMPQVIAVALSALSNPQPIYLAELSEPYGNQFEDRDVFLENYETKLCQHLSYIYEEIKDQDINKVGKSEFSRVLSSFLLSKLNKETILN